MARIKRIGYLSLGLLSLATGLIGLVVPLLPTTVFILIAAWAFARSSSRLHDRLLAHPRFGPLIAAWQRHRAIPRRAKGLALTALAAGFAFTAVTLRAHPAVVAAAGLGLGALSLFILTRPDLPPQRHTPRPGPSAPHGPAQG